MKRSPLVTAPTIYALCGFSGSEEKGFNLTTLVDDNGPIIIDTALPQLAHGQYETGQRWITAECVRVV